MVEKRRFLRIAEQDIIAYEILPPHKIVRDITEDLSVGGVRFFTKEFIPVSAILKVEIKLRHAAREITAIVKVKWIKQCFEDERYDLGAEFMEISSEDVKFLSNYLYKKSPGTC